MRATSIIESYYLSDPENACRASHELGLTEDELEQIVGRFTRQSHRHGALRGEVCERLNGERFIRHHFTKKIIWRAND